MVTTLYIDGMRSVHCARAVHTSLAQIEGLDAAEVVVGRATLEHRSPLDARALTSAIGTMGYVLREVVTERRHLPLHSSRDPLGDG